MNKKQINRIREAKLACTYGGWKTLAKKWGMSIPGAKAHFCSLIGKEIREHDQEN
jgi:hypothetical protein